MPSHRIRLTAAASALLCCALLPEARARAEGDDAAQTSSAAGNGVVVHGVDSKLLAARFRQVDGRVDPAERKELAKELAELLAGDVDRLVEDSQGIYLRGLDAAVLRTAALDPETLKAYRATVDARAEAALEEALRTRDIGLLEQAARRNALSTHGPRLLVALSDLRALGGRLSDAVQALEDLLRYWPRDAELPGVGRAAVLSRLAALYAVHGDRAGILGLIDDAPAEVLAKPSPVLPGVTLRVELERSAARAALAADRERSAISGGAASELELVAELSGQAPDPTLEDLARDWRRGTREIGERGLPLTTPQGPALLTRVTEERTRTSRLKLLGPPQDGVPAVVKGGVPVLRELWSWPDDQRLEAFHQGVATDAFEPAVAGDFLVFPWPSQRSLPSEGEFFESDSGPLCDLVVLSLGHEGRDVDIRGSDERTRDDRDWTLERLSFCGRPVVRDGAVYSTLVGRARDGGATELHVACFDLVPGGSPGSTVLRERWRTHVLDGSGLSDVRYSAETTDSVFDPLALPTAMAERYGRLYVGSNTGAVACIDEHDGSVQWIETYRQGPLTGRVTVLPTRSRTWLDVPALVDGGYVHVAPRDAESLLRFAAAPVLPSRSLLVDAIAVRGGGTARESGSPLGALLADDVVAVEDGVAYLSGQVPPRGLSAVLPQGTPLVAFRLRDARAGEPRNRVRAAQIPETCSSGHAVRVRDGLLYPAFKGIYRVPFPDVEDAARLLWRTPAPARLGGRQPDRVGNLVAAGGWVWSTTPARIALFRVK